MSSAPSRKANAAAALLAACGVACVPPPSRSNSNREQLLQSLAENAFVPTYAELAAHAATLEREAVALCDRPDHGQLVRARDRWRATRAPLKRAEAWHFGPIVDLGVDTAIDFWPARPPAIEDAIVANPAATPADVAALGTAAKGLPVAEYLLFSAEREDAVIIASLDPTRPEAAGRCAYLVATTARITVRTQQLLDAWDPAEGAYATRIGTDGDDSPGHPSLKRSVDNVVVALAFALQDITDAKLGRPLGLSSGGIPQPADVESRFAGDGRADILSNLHGVQQVYAPDTGMGLGDVVEALDEDLDGAVRQALVAATAAVEALSLPLPIAVLERPGPVIVARDAVRELRRLIEVDVAAVLGVTVGLSDNDGD